MCSVPFHSRTVTARMRQLFLPLGEKKYQSDCFRRFPLAGVVLLYCVFLLLLSLLSPTAERTGFLNARSLILSFSENVIPRQVFPANSELKTPIRVGQLRSFGEDDLHRILVDIGDTHQTVV